MTMCLQCRACETACPSLVPFGHIMEGARAEVQAQIPDKRSRWRRFSTVTALRSRTLLRLAALGAAILQRLRLLTRLPGIGKAAAGLRRLPIGSGSSVGASSGPADGPIAMVLSGCVSDAWYGDVHRATIDVLGAAGYRVEVPGEQTCCGALASHSGFADDAAAMATVNDEAFSGADVVVSDVAGCGAHLATYARFGGDAVADKVTDISSLVAAAIADGRLPTFPQTGTMVGVQDPCHLEHGLGTHTSVDEVVAAAGYTPKPIDRGGLCCGAAGLYQLDHPGVSETLGTQKADTVTRAGASIVVTGNAGCEMQLRRFAKGGVTILHPVELYANRLAEGNYNAWA